MILYPSVFARAAVAACLALTCAACGSTDGTGGTGLGASADAGTGDGALGGDAAGADDAAAVDTATAADVAAGTDAATADVASADAAADAAPSIDNLPCPSGQTYKGGTSNDMQPGAACIQCHTQQGGPGYLAAGTVYRNLITQTGCYASGKAGSVVPPASYTVELTDANGKVFKTTTSTLSGNFHMSGKSMTGFVPPYHARVIDGAGNERKMLAPQSNGDCNSCHSATGTSGAPGRIVAPDVP